MASGGKVLTVPTFPENNPRLRDKSDRELVLDWEGNIYLFAKKIDLLRLEIPSLSRADFQEAQRLGVDLNHMYEFPLSWTNKEAELMGNVQNERYTWTRGLSIGDPFGAKVRMNYEDFK